MRPALPAPGAPRGMPISTVSTRPACSLPGATKSPILGPWNVAVAVAPTPSPPPPPVDALTPEGTAQATTGASCALMAAMAEASGSRGEPSKPVPSRASTTTPDASSRSGAKGSGGAPGRRSRFSRASPRRSPRSAAASTSTSRPSSRSSRATTRPSPPLFPFPTTTRTGPGRASAAVTRARPMPARSIRSSEGTPWSSIAQASAARISAASNSGSSQSLTSAHRGYRGGQGRGVRQRHGHGRAQLRRARGRAPAEPDLGRRSRGDHLHIPEAPGREPERLRDRLLGAEAGGQVHHGPRVRGGVLPLRVGEEPLGELRRPLERLLQAVHLEEVDADAAHGGANYRVPGGWGSGRRSRPRPP